jgi:hypothetical protein
MTVLAQLLIAAALVATAVIYGTDVFAAIVLRPALAHVDDRTLTGATGYMHDYADRRLPVPGAIGLAATVSGTAVAALAGHPGAVLPGRAPRPELLYGARYQQWPAGHQHGEGDSRRAV